MSAFDFADVFESMWGNASPTSGEMATVNLREVGETSGIDAKGCEMWGPAPLVYRPAPPDADGKCQALTTEIGGRTIVLGTQDPRSAKATGALNTGDVALCSPTGKNVLRLNATGEAGIALVQQTKGDDAGIAIQRDGTIVLYNQWGIIELGSGGFVVTLKTGQQMSLDATAFQCVAPQGFVRCGVVGLGVAPAVPLTFAAPSGVAKPAPNIFV